MLRFRFAVAGAAFAALSCAALADLGQTEVLTPIRTITNIPCSPIDTNAFFPQIDNSIDLRKPRPENPLIITEPLSQKNNLPLGQVDWNRRRGSTRAYWPAIGYTGWIPPDPDLAVGPNNVVAVVNASIGFFSKTGTNTFLQASTTFFSGLGATSFQFDPKCFYDRVHDRFVISFVEQQDNPNVSKLLVAVSDDGNPTGTWYRYRIESMLNVGGTNYWLDYPGLGYNKDAIVVCGNMFGFVSGFAGVQFLVIPIAPLLSGGAASVTSLRDASGASAQVAEMIHPTIDRVYGVSRSGTSALRLYSVNNVTGSPTVTITSVAVPAFSLPSGSARSTNGRTLDAFSGDGRIFTVRFRGTRLVTSQNVQVGSDKGVRWHQVDMSNWPTSGAPSLVQSGNLTQGGTDIHMGAINQNLVGDVSIIATRSSTSITADIVYAGRMLADPAGTMGAINNLESSSGNNYSGGRWGDYFDCDVDPSNDTTFYGIGMGIASNNAWRTSIFSWNISTGGGGTVVVPPTSFTMIRGLVLAGGLPELLASDNQYLVMRPGIVFSTAEAPIQVQLDGTSANRTATNVKFTLEAGVNQGNIGQMIDLWNWNTNAYEQVDTRAASTLDSTVVVDITTNPQRFVNSTTGAVRAKVSFKSTGPVFSYPWQARMDYVKWDVTGS